MRVLLIDQEAKDKAAQVMAYARRHIYYPGPDAPVPGDNPNFVCDLNTYRCVFTYTRSPQDGSLHRHLSVSVPSPTKMYPSPEAMAMIAGLFEFTDASKGVEECIKWGKWRMHIEHGEPYCIILAEELHDEPPTAPS